MTEREKMERGDWYDPGADAELRAARHRASDLCHTFNQMLPSDRAGHLAILRELFGYVGDHANVLSPLQVDYGYNISLGDRSFINHGAYLMDCAPITIGNDVFIGAGSIVTRDIPAGMLAVGNPCRPVRKITEADRAGLL